MATRSYIGLAKGDKVEFIYCHHDGYLYGVGATLLNSYNELDKVRALIKLGDIKSLSADLQETAQDTFNESSNTISLERFKKLYADKSCWDIAYFYLFEHGKWAYATDKKGFVELTKKRIENYLKRLKSA